MNSNVLRKSTCIEQQLLSFNDCLGNPELLGKH